MSERRIRVGVIGAGTFAEQCHIPGIQAHADGEVVALCARNGERVAAVAQKFGIADSYTDYHELLARTDIDAVTIAGPDRLHFPMAIAALEAGKHVFCEKPLAMNVQEAQEMVEVAQRKGLVGMVSFTFRYARALQVLRRVIKEGVIGTPFAANVQVHWGNIGYPETKLTWREQAGESSAGILGDGASHLFDAIAYILAPVQRVAAQMMIVKRESGRVQPDSIDYATCQTLLSLTEGQDLSSGYVNQEPGIVQVSVLTSRVDRGQDEFKVVGTKGMLVSSLTRGSHESLRLLRDGEWSDVPLGEEAYTAEPLGLTRMMGAFIDAVKRGELAEGDPSFADGLHTQQAIDAAIRSAQQLQWVTV